MARWLAAFALLLAFAGQALAQGKAAAVEQVWRDWAAQQRLPSSTLAVAENGRIVARRGLGADPDQPFDLASLSKGITGACMAALVREDRLRLDTPLGLILGRDAARHANTPLSAFLTHSAGLWPDATQRMDLRQWARKSALHLPVARPALARRPRGAGKTRYNNENYAVLGAVIEAVTGQSYYTACARRLGLSGISPSPRWGGTGAFGGWRGSAASYTAVLTRHFGPRSPVGAAPRRWALNRIDGNSSYSMGMLTRSSRLGQVFWHAGLLCSSRKRGSGGYAVNFGNRLTVTVLFTGCVSENDLRDLGKRLTQVAVR